MRYKTLEELREKNRSLKAKNELLAEFNKNNLEKKRLTSANRRINHSNIYNGIDGMKKGFSKLAVSAKNYGRKIAENQNRPQKKKKLYNYNGVRMPSFDW